MSQVVITNEIPEPVLRRPTVVEKSHLVPATFVLTGVVGIFFLPGVILGLFAILYAFKARGSYEYGYTLEGERQHMIVRRFVAWQIGLTIIVYLAGISAIVFWRVLADQN